MKIDRDDVIRVAESLGKTLTEDQIKVVLDEYPSWVLLDPTSTWNLIVENLIYFVIYHYN